MTIIKGENLLKNTFDFNQSDDLICSKKKKCCKKWKKGKACKKCPMKI